MPHERNQNHQELAQMKARGLNIGGYRQAKLDLSGSGTRSCIQAMAVRNSDDG